MDIDRSFIRIGLGTTYFDIAVDCAIDHKNHALELDKV